MDSKRKLPRAAELLPDIFAVLQDSGATQRGLVSAVAARYGIPEDEIDVADPPHSNNHIRSKTDAAIHFLRMAGYIVRKAPKGPFAISPAGYRFAEALNPQVIGKLVDDMEPKLRIRSFDRAELRRELRPTGPRNGSGQILMSEGPKPLPIEERIRQAKELLRKERPIPPKRQEPEAPELSPEEKASARAAKIKASLPSMPLDKLYALWVNAGNVTKSSPPERWLTARLVFSAIEAERKRRGPDASSPLPGGGVFRWPTTEAENGSGRLVFEADDFGVLAQAGYRVGASRGEPMPARRRILARVFDGSLEGVSSNDDWGAPGSAERLKKIAFTIAALTRNAKRRGPQMRQAVDDWEADLDYLRERYYVGRFGFRWPDTGTRLGAKNDGVWKSGPVMP